MSKKTNASKHGGQSFWSTLPGVLTAIAAVITAIAGLIVALNAAGFFNNQGGPASSGTATPLPISAPPTAGQVSQTPVSTSLSNSEPPSASCFNQYFQGIAKDRVTSLEMGANSNLIRPDQVNDQPMGIILTDTGQPVGGLILQFFSDGQIFKVSSVVDSTCQQVENYSNMDRTTDKGTLQNWDTLKLNFGNIDYGLRLGYDGTTVGGNFTRLSQ